MSDESETNILTLTALKDYLKSFQIKKITLKILKTLHTALDKIQDIDNVSLL
jgi:hypothetical protein